MVSVASPCTVSSKQSGAILLRVFIPSFQIGDCSGLVCNAAWVFTHYDTSVDFDNDQSLFVSVSGGKINTQFVGNPTVSCLRPGTPLPLLSSESSDSVDTPTPLFRVQPIAVIGSGGKFPVSIFNITQMH